MHTLHMQLMPATHAKVYTYTHCGRKDHLANFSYDKLHVIENNVWVRNAKIQGPEKVWAPKGTRNLFEVSVSSSKT